MQDFVYNSFARVRGDKILLWLRSAPLRILCYHGVCEDRLAEKLWVPQFFVSRSVFEEQLRYLRDNANILPLAEAVQQLREGTLPPRSVAITFDDGYANNLEIAYPLLRQYGVPATIFLSTSYVESGEYYPFIRHKLIRQAGFDMGQHPLAEYKSSPIDRAVETASYWWERVRLDEDAQRTLRPMTVNEVRDADKRLIDFGAHTHSHCILRNETPERRRKEIVMSISKVAEWTGCPVRTFSYPNGERGDFNDADREVLKNAAVEAAVTGIAGANSKHSHPLTLRRYPITMGHGDTRFRAEVAGFRSALLKVAGAYA